MVATKVWKPQFTNPWAQERFEQIPKNLLRLFLRNNLARLEITSEA